MMITREGSTSSTFTCLAWSNLAAQSAEQVGLAAAPIVAVLALGAGAGETGLLQTAQTLPFLLLSIPAGVLADRMSRRRLMVSAEVLRAVSLVAILISRLPFGVVITIGPVAGLAAGIVMVLTIWIPSALLAGASFFLVGVGPILWVISTATLRQTVTPRDLLGRVSAIGMTASGARPIGAAIGAAVASVYGLEACLVVAAVGFLVQASIILTSPVLRLARQPEMVG